MDREQVGARHPGGAVQGETLRGVPAEADLEGARLTGGKLQGAELMGTILKGAEMLDVEGHTASQLEEAEIDEKTIKPLELQ